VSDPYNSHDPSLQTAAASTPPPLPLRFTVVQRRTGLARNWVSPINWLVAVVLIAIAISKHSSFGSTIFVLTPIALALLSRHAIESRAFCIIARVINGGFALLSLVKFLSLSPYASPTLSLTFFMALVVAPTFNVAFLAPKGDD